MAEERVERNRTSSGPPTLLPPISGTSTESSTDILSPGTLPVDGNLTSIHSFSPEEQDGLDSSSTATPSSSSGETQSSVSSDTESHDDRSPVKVTPRKTITGGRRRIEPSSKLAHDSLVITDGDFGTRGSLQEQETPDASFNSLNLDTDSSNAVNGRGKGLLYLTPSQDDESDDEDFSGSGSKEDYLYSGESNEQSIHHGRYRLNLTSTTPDKSNLTSYVIHGFHPDESNEDEGYIKLQTIIQAAERSILDFQNDIQVSNVYANLRTTGTGGKTSWLRPHGKFESGFWDELDGHAEKESNFIQTNFKGKPRKTLWTPSSSGRVVSNTSKIFSSQRSRETKKPKPEIREVEEKNDQKKNL